jgi:hypothetical protein
MVIPIAGIAFLVGAYSSGGMTLRTSAHFMQIASAR